MAQNYNQQKIFLALFVLSILSIHKVTAQKNPYNEVTIASPTAASLGKYADIPVSYHTGTPQISIPVYQITEGSLTLPISLSYHASGLRVMEPASWVGAGWSLNAGGVITRTVRGAPDEKFTSSVNNQTKGYFSDYGFSNYLLFNNNPYDTTSPIEVQAFLDNSKDGEPDLFTFNFGSYSGKFYFREDRTPVFEPAQDIKVSYVYTGTGSIQSFVLTAPDGVKYSFGMTASTNDTDPIERTNLVTGEAGYIGGTVISSWYLNKVESPDNMHNITLTYLQENYSYYNISMFPVSYDNGTTAGMNGSSNIVGYNLIKNVVTGVRLSTITFSNGTVDFIGTATRLDLNDASTSFTPEYVNTQAKRLDTIKVSSNNSSFCKKLIFSYSYFTDNAALQGYFAGYGLQTDSKRLRLDNIQEKSCNSLNNNPPYIFTYFSELLPRRLSFGQDHWGFYNGVTNNGSLIPTYTENEFTVFSGANRNPAWPAMRGGALQKITYPTGGSSTFIFEANDTYASTPRYNSVAAFSTYVGYGYSGTSKQEYRTLTANPYAVTLTNAGTGITANLNVYNSSSQLVLSLSATSGQTKQQTLKLGAAGTYSIVVSVPSVPPGGTGATASFSEQVPYTYSRNELVGGLRIKTITNSPTLGTSTVTNYSYLDNSSKSTGTLYSRPAYVQVLRNDEMLESGADGPAGNHVPGINTCSPAGCLSCDLGTSLAYYKSPSGIRPLSTSQGNHIGYNEVKVSQTGNGFSIYRYYGSDRWDTNTGEVATTNVNSKPLCNVSIPNFPAAPLQYEPVRGELKYEGDFDESGRILKEITNYIDTSQDKVTTPGTISVSTPSWNIGTTYYLTAFRIKSRKTVEVNYGATGTSYKTTTTQTSLASAFHNQPTRQVTYVSTGDSLITNYKYAADFRTTCDATSDCYASYQASVNAANANYYVKKNSCPTTGCIFNEYLAYKKSLAKIRATYIACRRTNYTDPNSTFNNCMVSKKGTAGVDMKPILELQAVNNNAVIETTGWRNLNLTGASFTKYAYAVVPNTSVYPKTVQKINLLAPSASFTYSTNTDLAVTKDSRYADETSIKFYSGSLVEVLPKSGVYTSYIWGLNNNYPTVKAIGVDQTTLLNAYNAVGGNLATLRSQPSLASAQVSTYAYTPLVGMITETSPQATSSHYEYDALGRLNLIRDNNNNILKKFCYNFQGQVEGCNLYQQSVAKSGTYTKVCSPGYTGSSVTYTVPAGTYFSTISVADADAKAQADVTANGQNYANTNGTCTLNAPMITVQGYNTKTSTYTVKFTNNADGQYYTFYLNPNTYSTYTLGQVPSGTYTVQFSPYGSPLYATHNINGYSQYAQYGATFYNISITYTSNATMY